MAVLALVPLTAAFVGSSTGIGLGLATATGMTFGGALLSTAVGLGASWLDSMFVYPALFGSSKAEGPRVEDLRMQTATEGSPYQFVLGTMRTAGTLIWASDLIEEKEDSGSSKSGKVTNYTYSCSFAVAFGAGPRKITKLWANGKVIYDLNIGGTPEYDSRYVSVSIYEGSDTQTADPVIEGYEGSGNVSGYRGTCYVVIEGLQLADFGNTIPQIQAKVEQDIADSNGVPLTDALDLLFDYAGWDTDFYDITNVSSGKELYGMVLNGVFDLSRALEPILFAKRLIARDTEGVLEILDREAADTLAVDEDDLGVHTEQPQAPYTISDRAHRDLPSSVEVRFIDPDHWFDQGMKTEKSPVFYGNNVSVVELPMAMPPDEARELAQVLLQSSFVEGQDFETTLPPKLMRIQESDIIARTIGARTRRVRATELGRGWNSMIEFKGYFEQPNTQSGNAPAYDPGAEQPGPLGPSESFLFVLDIAPLTNAEVNTPGVYVACSREVGQTLYRSTTVYLSLDGGTTYNSVAVCPTEATIGVAQTILADQPAWAGATPEPNPIYSTARDDTSTVEVELQSGGTLTSKTDTEVLNGANWMLVGNEVIGFVTATLVSGSTYELSQLYRGLLNTQHACASHASDETCVLLNTALQFVPISLTNRSATLYWKGVPLYGVVSGYSAFSQVWKAENVKCFRPYAVDATRDGSDITITWERDTRYPKQAATYGGTLEETSIMFKIVIWEDGEDPTTDTPLRDVTVSFAAGDPLQWEYTAAMQTTDARAVNGDPILVKIYQVGGFVNMGRYVYVDAL